MGGDVIYSRGIKIFTLSLFFFISILLFVFSPSDYSFEFCFISLILYFFSFFTLVKFNKTKNLFNFNIIFSITYFFIYFAYPCFVYPIAPKAFYLFTFGFNDSTISKSTVLALVGYNSFVLGISLYKSKTIGTRKIENKYYSIKLINIILTVLVPLFCLINISYIGQSYSSDVLWFSKGIWGYISLFKNGFIYLGIAFMFSNHKHKIYKHTFEEKFFIFLVCIDTASILILGSRTIPLILVLILIYYYSEIIRPISFKKLILLITIGILALGILGWIRLGYSITSMNNNGIGLLNFASELIVNNRTLFVGVDYADEKGTLISSLLLPFCGLIPFLQSIVINIFNIPAHEVSSALFFTFLEFGLGKNPDRIGLGTNMIASLYLGGKLIAVIVGMLFVGYIKEYIEKQKCKNIFLTLLQIIFIGCSVFWVRSEISHPFAEFSRCVICYLLILFVYRSCKNV